MADQGEERGPLPENLQPNFVEFTKISAPSVESFYKKAWNKILERRRKLYKSLKAFLPQETLVYYPASGADPVPVETFGDHVVYGSLLEPDDDYLGLVKHGSPGRPGLMYHKALKSKGPYPLLKAVYADIKYSPFPSDTFEAIIINNFPAELLLDEQTVQGLHRDLKPSGLVVFEDMEYNFKDMPSKELAIQNMLVNGFRKHPLTHQIGADVTAFYYHDNSDRPPFTSVWQLLDKLNTPLKGESREPFRHRMDIFIK